MAKQYIKISDKARDEIKALLAPVTEEAAKRISDACNEQSSWGFYEHEADVDGAVVHVSLHPDAGKDNARAQRILRNIDRGMLR